MDMVAVPTMASCPSNNESKSLSAAMLDYKAMTFATKLV